MGVEATEELMVDTQDDPVQILRPGTDVSYQNSPTELPPYPDGVELGAVELTEAGPTLIKQLVELVKNTPGSPLL